MAKQKSTPFAGGAVTPGSGLYTTDIHPLILKRNGTELGSYNPLDAPETEIEVPGIPGAKLPLMVDSDGYITNGNKNCVSNGQCKWAEGEGTEARASHTHAEGYMTLASGQYSHVEGVASTASGMTSHAEGHTTTASGNNSHSEGSNTTASADNAHAEGHGTQASGNHSHAEGYATKALVRYSHSEGAGTTSNGDCAHSEGRDTTASGGYSHSEGYHTTASGVCAHAEGGATNTGGGEIDIEGPVASGNHSHAEGTGTVASGTDAHAQGLCTRASGNQSFAVGKYNDDGTALFVIGNGTSDSSRRDVFKIDLSGNAWVLIGGVLTQITALGGGCGVKMYPTVADAITDQANLAVGDYFVTNGFNTERDFGAGRYKVTDSGTANGMDIISLAAGKYAVLQTTDEAFPEQFGYNKLNDGDVTPYFSRMISANVRNIKLAPCGSDSHPYRMLTGLTITQADITFEGVFGFTTGYAPRIWFVPSSYGLTYTPMFKLEARGFFMKNIVLMNRPWWTESDTHNCVCLLLDASNPNNMWYEFESLAIQGFSVGIANVPNLDNSGDGLQWHCVFRQLAMALNTKNVYFKGLTYITRFENCFFTVNTSGAESVSLEESFTVEFDCCNFGIYNPASTVVKLNKYVVVGAPVEMRWSSAKFTNCNFEIESDGTHPLPTSNSGFFLNCDDDDEFHVEMDNCVFIITPLARADNYGNRAFSLGDHTYIILRNCVGPYVDVKYSGNEFYEWDFEKRMFDGTRSPAKAIGSVEITHCTGIIPPPNNAWGSAYLPVVKTDNMSALQSDNNTNFPDNYPTARDGVLLVNLDDASVNTKIGNSIVQVVAPAANKVRIGDRIYDYVVVDGRKWITTDLQLFTMNGRVWRYYSHPEYGFYYKTTEFAEIDSLLPTGWRRPNYNDCQSLISQGYAAVQKTGYSQWSSATNTTGVSIQPCSRWREPDVTPDWTKAYIWGPEESGVGWHLIFVSSNSISYGGWNYAEAANIKCPVRVCADA